MTGLEKVTVLHILLKNKNKKDEIESVQESIRQRRNTNRIMVGKL
jgi:hypothetical protein